MHGECRSNPKYARPPPPCTVLPPRCIVRTAHSFDKGTSFCVNCRQLCRFPEPCPPPCLSACDRAWGPGPLNPLVRFPRRLVAGSCWPNVRRAAARACSAGASVRPRTGGAHTAHAASHRACVARHHLAAAVVPRPADLNPGARRSLLTMAWSATAYSSPPPPPTRGALAVRAAHPCAAHCSCGEVACIKRLAPGDIGDIFARAVAARPGAAVLSRDPWLVTLDGFATDEEVAALLATNQGHFQRSLDAGGLREDGTLGRVQTAHRTSSNAWCNHNTCLDSRPVRRKACRAAVLLGCWATVLPRLADDPRRPYGAAPRRRLTCWGLAWLPTVAGPCRS